MTKKTPSPVVQESSSYENCLDYVNVEDSPPSLSDFFGEEIQDTADANPNWEKHWVGMPAFVQEKKEPRSIKINFRNDEDFKEFAILIGQKHLNEKSKSTWFPKLEKDKENQLKRWIEDE